jgi:glutamate-1-semialdehyde 2,1-aminomutase
LKKPSEIIRPFQGDEPFQRPRGMTFSSECCRLGILIHPHHNWFLSLVHTEDVIKDTFEVTKQAMQVVKQNFGNK